MQRKKLDIAGRIKDRRRAMNADRLRRAAAATQIPARHVDDAARRAHFGI